MNRDGKPQFTIFFLMKLEIYYVLYWTRREREREREREGEGEVVKSSLVEELTIQAQEC